MDTLDIIAMLLALALGTQLCRFLPLVLPQAVVSHPILAKLNRTLPLVILLLLVLTSLSFPQVDEGYQLLIAQVLSLGLVVASYRWLGNVLLSVALGIGGMNGLLWLL
ncbi:branched-chain amino acid transport [Pasteurellaceae bacterium RH1A]|nr:branched-chain amino acid transport [Pasteurellaceae bacterium RH1A]